MRDDGAARRAAEEALRVAMDLEDEADLGTGGIPAPDLYLVAAVGVLAARADRIAAAVEGLAVLAEPAPVPVRVADVPDVPDAIDALRAAAAALRVPVRGERMPLRRRALAHQVARCADELETWAADEVRGPRAGEPSP